MSNSEARTVDLSWQGGSALKGFLPRGVNGRLDSPVCQPYLPLVVVTSGLLFVVLWGEEYGWGWSGTYSCWQHSVLEYLNVSVALSVFRIGWHAGTRRQTLRGLAFSTTFVAVGLLNFFHLLSMPEMPSFATSNTLGKAMLFASTSNLCAAAGLLRASLLPWRRVNDLIRWTYLGGTLLVTLLLTLTILFWKEIRWEIVIGGQTIVAAGLVMGLAAIGLSSIVFGRTAASYVKRNNGNDSVILNGMGIWILSQVAFLLSRTPCDIYGLVGHIYKVIAYGYTYWRICVPAVRRPHRSLDDARTKLKGTRRLRALARIVRRLAHELKNPLAAISASAQLSAILDDRIERERVTHRIKAEVDRLNELINLTLEIGWDRAADWDWVHIEELIREICQLWSAEFDRLEIDSRIYVEEGIPAIQGNRKLLQRALTNLVLNAVEAMPEGGELCLAAYEEVEGSSVRIEVTDTGPGIPGELRDQLFQEFVTTKPRGTGLGLMIVHQIITEIHRGQIWFETISGEGTRFLMRLPVIRIQQ